MRVIATRLTVATLLLIVWTACAPSIEGQSFKKVSVKGGAKMKQIVAGGTSVWALATNGIPYVYKANKFIPAGTSSLSQIAVGGGNLRQPDSAWGLDSAGQVYNIVKNGTSWVFNQMPGTLSLIAVGIGYQDSCHPYEVWGLSPSAQIYRFSYCIGNWELIPGTLGTMSVGGGEVWGINGNREAYRFDFQSLTFVFETVPADSISVRSGDAWTVYHERGGPNEIRRFDLQYGWSLLGDAPQLQVGGDGVWALKYDGLPYRFELNQDGEHRFTVVPGVTFTSLSVGSGAGVWGIDPSGQVFAFSTK